MSYIGRFMLVARIVPTAPPGFVTWLDECIGGRTSEPCFDVPEVAAALVSEAAWLLGACGRLVVVSEGPQGSERELAVFASNLSDGASAAVYGLALLVAPYCDDGTIAVTWTDMSPDVDPTLFFAQKGVLFVGRRNGNPVPVVNEGSGQPAWANGMEPPQVRS